ncbi:cation-translocating P-type ATPase [Planomonospora parontospora]|uniref:cation-translocating P-type ATPase n=1 Tax=Planomonospora parontospora TaxID=58119 RepID=UPI00166F9941|nr:HAD-IC family P-type ATPase [Planomonospora parontospora]GGL17673.1 putative cation-transporting ATPase I [Planomonospora parontospora subsp. antibiotica]GII15219.1 putative cation-transporting ATPase I [Planomonospora parontospora subsp. antibiotica]
MFLSRLLAIPADVLRDVVPDVLAGVLPRSRRVRPCPGGVRIDLHVIGGPGTETAARRLEARLRAVDGVERAEVNGALGCVFVGTGEDRSGHDELLSIVTGLDTDPDRDPGPDGDGDTAPEPDAGGAGPYRSRVRVAERHARAAARLCAELTGAGLALAGKAVRLPGLSPAVPALLHLADSTPLLREELNRRIGRSATDTLFTAGHVVGQTLALSPSALLVHAAGSVVHYAEARAARCAWRRLEQDLGRVGGAYRHIAKPASPRPAPLPRGPIERYADVAAPVTLGAYAATRLLSRSGHRSHAMMVAATPKQAKLGRHAFAGAVARALGRRGAVVLDPHALRRMDRVDTVVLDAAVLLTGSWTVERVLRIADPGGAADGKDRAGGDGAAGGKGRAGGDGGDGADRVDDGTLHARLHALLDPGDPGARREDGEWAVGPVTGTGGPAAREVQAWRARGLRPVAVTLRGEPVAVAALTRELHPLAEALVAAAGDAGTVLLAGGDRGLAARFSARRIAPGGARTAAAVRALQTGGHAVAVVSRGASRDLCDALARADLGIGVADRPGRVPWDADVLGDLDGAHLLLSCLPKAARTSRRSVRLGVAGAGVGALLAVAGSEAASPRRAHLVSHCVSLSALALGELSGRAAGRTPVPVRADGTPWYAMSAADVLTRLGSSSDGIAEEDAAGRRTEAAGEEERPGRGPRSLVRASARELANPMTPVLAAGAGLSALIGSVLDALLIGGVTVVSAFVGGAQRVSADRALRRLTEDSSVPVRLRRPGGHTRTSAAALVPGDVIELRAGDAVPADCRVLEAAGLEVDESPLTGESQLVAKTAAPTVASAVAERSCMLYQGTTVAAGGGRAVVVATGEATEAGRGARLAAGPRPPTGVELRLRELGRRILPLSAGSGLALLAVDLLRGRPLAAGLAPAVSLAVAAVPEGLPFIATVAELAAARRLSKRAALVRNPSTIEALGRVNVLCFDKTGTLTEGRISLRRVSDGRTGYSVEEPAAGLRPIVAAALRASPRAGGGRVIAHPTDRAVVDGAHRLGVTPEEGLTAWRRVDELPFEPERGYHAVLGVSGSGHLLSVKGAPEIVLDRCTTVLRDARAVPLGEELRLELEREVDALARQGHRVLAVAQRPASDRRDLDGSRVGGLCFLGFLGLADPVRPAAAESVGHLTRAGVRVVMVTGDHPSTAEAIAAELGVLNGLRVMTGPEMDDVDDEILTKALPEVAVFARATPAHKTRIVSCLRQAGETVAVTGDGANDAPAIRAADVGIALGSRATPAARTAADVVVTDDRIETIVDAIIEGRSMWSSVRDSLSILLGGNIGEIAFTVGSNLLTGRSALNARQLLLVNLLTDMLPALVVAVRPPAATSPERLMAEGPEGSLGASLTRDIHLRAVTTAAAAAAAWLAGRLTGTRGRADTIGLVALVAAQLLQTLAKGGRDPVVVLAALASLAVLGLVVSTPGVSRFFGSRPLGPVGWSIGLGGAAVATVLGAAAEQLLRGGERAARREGAAGPAGPAAPAVDREE